MRTYSLYLICADPFGFSLYHFACACKNNFQMRMQLVDAAAIKTDEIHYATR